MISGQPPIGQDTSWRSFKNLQSESDSGANDQSFYEGPT